MVKKRVDRLVAFDFDDTLAETSSLIGARFSGGELCLEEFLFERNIHFSHFEKDFWWIDSANYALLEDVVLPEGVELEFDYSQTMSIDLDSVVTIEPILKLMKESLSRKNDITLVVTARAGDVTTYSPSLEKEVTSSNREQILKFLLDRGVKIPLSNLHTVGDMMDNTALAKAIVVSHYIGEYSPDEVVFYDDSSRNLRAVEALCSQKFPEVNMKMIKVTAGRSKEFKDYLKTEIKEQLHEILNGIPE